MSRLIKDKDYKITEGYGKNHTGVDIIGTTGGPSYIKAHSAGQVYNIVDGKNNAKGTTGIASYGNYIQIKHKDGYFTLYAHLEKGLKLKKGDTVKEGEVIGTMGNSGNSYGTHLHYEVRNPNNYVIDPTKYIEGNLPNEDERGDDMKLYYRVHLLKEKKWLPWVEQSTNEKPNYNEYAGLYGKQIDGIQIKLDK